MDDDDDGDPRPEPAPPSQSESVSDAADTADTELDELLMDSPSPRQSNSTNTNTTHTASTSGQENNRHTVSYAVAARASLAQSPGADVALGTASGMRTPSPRKARRPTPTAIYKHELLSFLRDVMPENFQARVC